MAEGPLTREAALAMDEGDELAFLREAFALPKSVVYLDDPPYRVRKEHYGRASRPFFALLVADQGQEKAGSVPVRQVDRKRESAHQCEAEGPSRIQIEPASRHECETQVAIDQPRQEAAGCDHRDGVDDGHQNGHAEIGIDEGTCRLMAAVGIGGTAKTKIDRYQHQSGAMRDRHGEGPQPQLCGSYPRQHPRMALVDEPEDAETNDQEAGADQDLRCHWTRATSREKGRITTSIASRWPTISGQSAAARARELISISPAETASGRRSNIHKNAGR